MNDPVTNINVSASGKVRTIGERGLNSGSSRARRTVLFADNSEEELYETTEVLQERFEVISVKKIEEAKDVLTSGRIVHGAIIDAHLHRDFDVGDLSGILLALYCVSNARIPTIIRSSYPSWREMRDSIGPAVDMLPKEVLFISKHEFSDELLATVDGMIDTSVPPVGEKYSWEELLEAQARLETLLQFDSPLTKRHSTARLRYDRSNIVGIGIGEKIVGTEQINIACITVFVKKKVAPEAITESLVPLEMNGVPTDVVESGELTFSVSPQAPTKTCGGGMSIGSFRGGSGTLGCIVEREGKKLILTAGHVVINGRGCEEGDWILSHPRALTGGRAASQRIARLSAPIIHLSPTEPNNMDCAIAEITPDVTMLDNHCFGPISPEPIPSYNIPELLKKGILVNKCGSTTGNTRGEIMSYPASVKLKLDSEQVIRLRGQIIILSRSGGRFSSMGDSGAIVVTGEENRPVGLLIGDGETLSVASPIDTILSHLRVSIVQ